MLLPGNKQAVADKPPETVQTDSKTAEAKVTEAVPGKAENQESASKVLAANEPKPVVAKPTKPKTVKPKTAKTKPVDAGQSSKESSESKPVRMKEPADSKVSAESKSTTSKLAAGDKPADSSEKPATPKKRAPRKKAAHKKDSDKTIAKPAAEKAMAVVAKTSPLVAAEKDSKGIYTLKPPPSENSLGE